ncbi:ATP-binding protein [Streptomyces sp. NBC_01006]|uniref:ATP-binding protein n=1 Tax=Streptomyces sp. NBC_01006 TaxID=2903716 RepID=UPI00386518BB
MSDCWRGTTAGQAGPDTDDRPGARQAARAFLEARGQPAIGREQADTVALVVSELVTNAPRHGGGVYALRLAAHPGTIEVAIVIRQVRDRGSGPGPDV